MWQSCHVSIGTIVGDFDSVLCIWVGLVDVFSLAIDKSENLLAQVEMAFDSSHSDSEVRRRVADLVKFELPVDFVCDLQHMVDVVHATE